MARCPERESPFYDSPLKACITGSCVLGLLPSKVLLVIQSFGVLPLTLVSIGTPFFERAMCVASWCCSALRKVHGQN